MLAKAIMLLDKAETKFENVEVTIRIDDHGNTDLEIIDLELNKEYQVPYSSVAFIEWKRGPTETTDKNEKGGS